MTVQEWKAAVWQAWVSNDQEEMSRLRDQELIDSLDEDTVVAVNFVDISTITEYGF